MRYRPVDRRAERLEADTTLVDDGAGTASAVGHMIEAGHHPPWR
jgi:DNA-binding LacI/PurR family transcriptional regulator